MDSGVPVRGTVAIQTVEFENCTSNTAEKNQHSVVIRDADGLREEYEKTVWLEGPRGDLPTVDFDVSAVLALYFGKGSCNNELTVTATEDGATIEVRAMLALPGGSCVVQPLETYPFAFVTVPLRESYGVIFGESNFTCD
jgi:hypothetical protein